MAAEHDLDNLRLEELGPGRPAMETLFELEALMLTGMCLDLSSLAARLREQVCEASGVGPRGWQCGGWADSGTCWVQPPEACLQLPAGQLSCAPPCAAHLQIHPRGVQLQLLPLSAPPEARPLVDTLVMSNLGYFQLKSGPGLWKLKLAPGGLPLLLACS